MHRDLWIGSGALQWSAHRAVIQARGNGTITWVPGLRLVLRGLRYETCPCSCHDVTADRLRWGRRRGRRRDRYRPPRCSRNPQPTGLLVGVETDEALLESFRSGFSRQFPLVPRKKLISQPVRAHPLPARPSQPPIAGSSEPTHDVVKYDGRAPDIAPSRGVRCRLLFEPELALVVDDSDLISPVRRTQLIARSRSSYRPGDSPRLASCSTTAPGRRVNGRSVLWRCRAGR